ncbi:MAG TPA: MarR family transcriptional regulator [Phycisphaerae bacterium]|nr:MarR family transcriptional regulator [Phycisphaerae bacterium]HRY68234.1 MarR family transcriptional regulator [Phycisphaerae bacterium]HSA28582.1 MarR family transcriptional regulator [Phycisphaerae bacterium]
MPTSHDIAMALRTAYWAMHRRADTALSPHKVTANQFVLLALLAEQDGVTQQELVRRASSDANTIRAMLVLLENQGLVARRPHPTDGRARNVALTPKGRHRYVLLWNKSQDFRRRLIRLFTPGETDLLVEYLQRIAEGTHPMVGTRRGHKRTVRTAGRGRGLIVRKTPLRRTEP